MQFKNHVTKKKWMVPRAYQCENPIENLLSRATTQTVALQYHYLISLSLSLFLSEKIDYRYKSLMLLGSMGVARKRDGVQPSPQSNPLLKGRGRN